MQDKEWIIERVSQEPAREWNNPKGGIVYYKKVMLAGHDKPVSVGKKDPSVLQPGGKLSGHIEVNVSDPEDKFRPAPMGFVANRGQTSFGDNSKLDHKDNSDGQRQGMCFNNAANWVNQHEQIDTPDQWANKVFAYANALYKLGDLGQDGGSTSDSLKAPISPKTETSGNPQAASPSKSWQVDTRKPDAKLWPSDKEDAEAVSLYKTFAGAEEVPLEEWPKDGYPF